MANVGVGSPDRGSTMVARALARYLRSVLPTTEYGTCSGISVPRPAESRKLFDGLWPGLATPEHTEFEGGLAAAHRAFTEPDDRVTIVGGGYGITTVVAAERGAQVTVYEASESRLTTLRRTLRLNDVETDSVTLRRAVVGELAPAEAAEKGLADDELPAVAPADLPETDVLELDCEGAELAILRALAPDALPRVVAVEIHPIKLDGAADEVVPALRRLGYVIRRRSTHDGIELSESAFRDLLSGETPGVGGEAHQEYPPVVVAER